MTDKRTHEADDLELLLSMGSPNEVQSFLRLLQSNELSELHQQLSPQVRPRFLNMLHPSELADLLAYLPEEEWGLLLEDLNAEQLSNLLTELEEPEVERMLQRIQKQTLPALLAEMESDDAADILGELPQTQVLQILEQMPDEDSKPIETLLQYPEDTAGGLMQTELIRIVQSHNVNQAIEAIREQARPEEDLDIYQVYVVSQDGQLQGQVALDSLILATPETPILELLEPESHWVPPHLDQEEVATYFQRYNLVALPVVDEKHHLLGRITVDDIVDVIAEEASEDILQMAGASGKEDLVYDRVIRSTFLRLPWLFTNLGGGLLTGYLMWLYKATLSEIMALITFVPVITGMGGNVGTQSSSITVRGFAINRIVLSNFGRYLFKEMRVGALMGLLCGVSLSLIGWLWHGNPMLGVVVGISLLTAMTIAACTGCMFPAFFQYIKIDPALASGPFVTTINDVTGILIYLGTATFCRQWLIG